MMPFYEGVMIYDSFIEARKQGKLALCSLVTGSGFNFWMEAS
jgi:hypothetical protein